MTTVNHYKDRFKKHCSSFVKPAVVDVAFSMWEAGKLQMHSKPGDTLPISDAAYLLFVLSACNDENFENQLNSIHHDSQHDGLAAGWHIPQPGSVAVTYRLILALQIIIANDLEEAKLEDLQQLKICRTGISTTYKNYSAGLGQMKPRPTTITGKALHGFIDKFMR